MFQINFIFIYKHDGHRSFWKLIFPKIHKCNIKIIKHSFLLQTQYIKEFVFSINNKKYGELKLLCVRIFTIEQEKVLCNY